MPSVIASGNGYWLATCLLVVLLGLYLWLIGTLVQQLRHSDGATAPYKPVQNLANQPKFHATLALLVGLLCLLPLADYWFAGYSGYHSIGGLLPYSDAADWLHGALNLASQGELTDWAARRPLNAVFLAGLLYLSDTQVPLMLVLRALLVAAALACWCRELLRHMLALPALFTSLLVVVLAYPYLPVLLSESHGLLFGLLGFTLLLRGVSNRQLASYAVGAGLLSCALMLRMGGFGILLSLLLWPLALSRATGSWRWLLATAVSISVGLGLSLVWGSLVYSGTNTSGSNFSYTLYGLAHAGAPWQLFFEHYPALLQQPEAAQASLAYRAAWAQIQSEPLALLQGWWQFFTNYWRFLFDWVPGALGQFLLPVFALGLIQLLWGWRDLNNRFILFCFAGVLLTTPWIFWSANASRAFIATTTLELLIVGRGLHVLVLGSHGAWRQAIELQLESTNATKGQWGSWLTVGLGIACLTFIPSLASLYPPQATASKPTSTLACTAPARRLWVDPKLASFVGLYGDSTAVPAQEKPGHARWNHVTLKKSDFVQHRVNPNPIATAVSHTSATEAQLWWVFDANTPKRYRYLLLTSPNLLNQKTPVQLCVEPFQGNAQAPTKQTSKPEQHSAEESTSPALLWQAVAS